MCEAILETRSPCGMYWLGTEVDEWPWYRYMLPVHVPTETPWDWPVWGIWSESPGLKLPSGKSLYVLSTSSTRQGFTRVTAKILLHCVAGIQWLQPGRANPRSSSEELPNSESCSQPPLLGQRNQQCSCEWSYWIMYMYVLSVTQRTKWPCSKLKLFIYCFNVNSFQLILKTQRHYTYLQGTMCCCNAWHIVYCLSRINILSL